MALDEKNNERNYLFGRLLAVADVAEIDAMSDTESYRQTNAMRYLLRFQQRPLETWMKLFAMLQPYLERLKGKSIRYTKLIDEITSKFLPGDMATSCPLDGRFLEGYSCQKQALFTKKNVADKNVEGEIENGSSEE